MTVSHPNGSERNLIWTVRQSAKIVIRHVIAHTNAPGWCYVCDGLYLTVIIDWGSDRSQWSIYFYFVSVLVNSIIFHNFFYPLWSMKEPLRIPILSNGLVNVSIAADHSWSSIHIMNTLL